jgi:hypothetical protein
MEIIVTQLEAGSFFLSTSAAPGTRRIFSPPRKTAVSMQNRYQNTDEVPARESPVPQPAEPDVTSEELPDSNVGNERVEGLPDADPEAARVDTDGPPPPPAATSH